MTDSDEVRRVDPDAWLDSVRVAREEGFGHFDWIGCVDEIGRDVEFEIVLRLMRPDAMAVGLRLVTRVPRDRPRLASIATVFPGAGWHERESAELFDVVFVDGDARRLLLAADAEAGVLRKEQALGARAGQPWPGAVEPGESAPDPAGVGRRRRAAPPGVPDPQVWGDRRDPDSAVAEDVARSASGGRGRRQPR